MFPDSDIAKKRLVAKQNAHIIVYGVAPYVKELLEAKLRTANHLVTLISRTTMLKKGRMDTHVRLWDDDANTVITRYLDSVFLGKASAEDIFEKYESSCASIDKSKIIQNSCDAPNVNLKFLEAFLKKSARN